MFRKYKEQVMEGKYLQEHEFIEVSGKGFDGKMLYIYGRYSYHSSGHTIYKCLSMRSGIGPIKIDLDKDFDDYYLFGFLVTDQPQDVSTVWEDIPEKYWYMYNDTNGSKIRYEPKRYFYYPGDQVIVLSATECSSSSSSCHHTSKITVYDDGTWWSNSHYHNHGGCADPYTFTIPNRWNHEGAYVSSDLLEYDTNNLSKMTKIKTSADVAKEDNIYDPFSNPFPAQIKVNGTWVDNDNILVKVNGEWQDAKSMFVKVNGEWKEL